MLILRPFRPWNFASESARAELFELVYGAKSTENRSKFVQYGQIAAAWRRWVDSGELVQDQVASFPVAGGYQYAIAELGGELPFIPLSTVQQSAKETQQRLLEAALAYVQPVVIDRTGVLMEETVLEAAAVLAGADLALAALEMQAINRRPNRIKPTDHALVAWRLDVTEIEFSPRPVCYRIGSPEVVRFQLLAAGFAVGQDPSATDLTVRLGGELFSLGFEALQSACAQHFGYARLIEHLLSVRNADITVRPPEGTGQNVKIATVTAPKLPQNPVLALKSLSQTSFGCYEMVQPPGFGVNMGHLVTSREFART